MNTVQSRNKSAMAQARARVQKTNPGCGCSAKEPVQANPAVEPIVRAKICSCPDGSFGVQFPGYPCVCSSGQRALGVTTKDRPQRQSVANPALQVQATACPPGWTVLDGWCRPPVALPGDPGPKAVFQWSGIKWARVDKQGALQAHGPAPIGPNNSVAVLARNAHGQFRWYLVRKWAQPKKPVQANPTVTARWLPTSGYAPFWNQQASPPQRPILPPTNMPCTPAQIEAGCQNGDSGGNVVCVCPVSNRVSPFWKRGFRANPTVASKSSGPVRNDEKQCPLGYYWNGDYCAKEGVYGIKRLPWPKSEGKPGSGPTMSDLCPPTHYFDGKWCVPRPVQQRAGNPTNEPCTVMLIVDDKIVDQQSFANSSDAAKSFATMATRADQGERQQNPVWPFVLGAVGLVVAAGTVARCRSRVVMTSTMTLGDVKTLRTVTYNGCFADKAKKFTAVVKTGDVQVRQDFQTFLDAMAWKPESTGVPIDQQASNQSQRAGNPPPTRPSLSQSDIQFGVYHPNGREEFVRDVRAARSLATKLSMANRTTIRYRGYRGDGNGGWVAGEWQSIGGRQGPPHVRQSFLGTPSNAPVRTANPPGCMSCMGKMAYMPRF